MDMTKELIEELKRKLSPDTICYLVLVAPKQEEITEEDLEKPEVQEILKYLEEKNKNVDPVEQFKDMVDSIKIFYP